MNLQWLLATSFLAVFSWDGGQQSTSSTTCPEYNRVSYSPPRQDWPGSIQVEHVPGKPQVSRTDRQPSPQGTASYILREPDTTKSGPWTSVVEVFGNEARPIHIRIRLTDHTSGGVRARWVNEQLLWLQMWRGRIVSTDVILNVDSGQFIYEQDANYNSLTVPCSMKRGIPK